MKETLLLERARKDLKRCVKMLSESGIEMTEEYSLFLESVNKTISEIGIATSNFIKVNNDTIGCVDIRKSNPDLVKTSLDEILTDMGWEENQVLIRRRKLEYVGKRQFLCYILRSVYRFSIQDIGNVLGGYNHSTVISNIQKFLELYSAGDKIVLNMVQVYVNAQELNNSKHGQVAE